MFNITQHYGVSNFATNKETHITTIPSTGLAGYRYPSQFDDIWAIGKTKHIPSHTPHVVTLFDLFHFHKVTAGQYLTDSQSLTVITQLLDTYPNLGKGRILCWGNQLKQYDCAMYGAITNLELFGDRIVNITPPKTDGLAFTAIKSAGLKLSQAYKPFIDFINTTTDFKYSHNVVNFLKGMIEIHWAGSELYGYPTFDRKIASKVGAGSHFRIARQPTEKGMFYTLLALYLSDYKQWFDSGSYVKIEDCDVYIDHHTVFESSDLIKYFNENLKYPNQLPFGIHPSEYYADRIKEIADVQYHKYHTVVYPKDFNGYINLEGSSHRQLLNGVDLVQEGRRMRHCVGGDNYLDHLIDGDMIFFHLEVPDLKHGATLSMVPHQRKEPGAFWLNGSGWELDQYYGFDDESLRNHSEAQRVLDEFRNTYFEVIPYPEIISLPRNMGKAVNVNFINKPAGVEFNGEIILDSFSQLADSDFSPRESPYRNTPGNPSSLSIAMSEHSAPTPILDMISRWMSDQPKNDFSLDHIAGKDIINGGIPIGGFGVVGITGYPTGKSNFYQHARHAAMMEVREREMKLIVEAEPFKMSVDSIDVDGVTHHYIKKDILGVKGTFTPDTLRLPLLSYEFGEVEIGNSTAGWLEIRRSVKLYGERDSIKFMSKSDLDDNIRLRFGDVPIFISQGQATELIRPDGNPISVDLRKKTEELKHAHLDVTIKADSIACKFENIVRVKVGDVLHIDMNIPIRLLLEPVYSTIRTQLAHCITLVNKENSVERKHSS